ncbi:hypothetical protein LJR235_003606 [Pararhizobium sp. LjRoot235]|uniref:hypothetical protein n=1 Tax=Pararhizobium sp. LjRoot235 TaxID=3342291 RepID=UPI003ECF9F8E
MSPKFWGCSAVIVAATSIATATATFSPSSFAPMPAFAEANQVSFPPLDDLEHYTTVRRGVTREHMLTSRAALNAIEAGQPMPPGTHVVLVDYQSDVLTRYLVAQKMGDGAEDWQYQWFWPDRAVKADENVAQCYSCHRSRVDNQFLFTFDDAVSFQ